MNFEAFESMCTPYLPKAERSVFSHLCKSLQSRLSYPNTKSCLWQADQIGKILCFDFIMGPILFEDGIDMQEDLVGHEF